MPVGIEIKPFYLSQIGFPVPVVYSLLDDLVQKLSKKPIKLKTIET